MKRVAIISPNKDAVSETFIKAHRQMLDGVVSYLYGNYKPKYTAQGEVMLDYPRFYERFLARLSGNGIEDADIRGIKKHLIDNKINVIFAEYGLSGNAILPIAKSLNMPVIVHFHGFDASLYEIINKENYYTDLFSYASKIIVVSRLMEKTLISIGAPPEKIVYTVCGPSEVFFTITPNYSSKTFLSIGRFVDKKAPYLTLMAFRELLKHHPDARLIMAGDGPLWNCIKNLIDYFGLGNSVLLPGAVQHKQVIELMSQACCFVQHSITAESGDSEGTPVAILEAQAAGLPVVSTFHAGIPDVVINQKTGFLVEEKDVAGMAAAFKAVLNADKAAIGEVARKRIKENFSMQHHIHILNQAINSI